MNREPRVWVLNLDAEQELESGRGYQPSDRMRRIVDTQSQRLVGRLVGPDDIVLGEDDHGHDPRARGLAGLAWSPTPWALARLTAAGATPAQTTPVEVLRAVNARPFAADVRTPLVDSSFEKHPAMTLEQCLERLAQPAPHGWLVRRTFGAAGRGRRRIRAGRPDDAERSWLVASLRRGPLILEPWVHITREYTRSAWIAPTGEVDLSRPCFQATTTDGAWTETVHAARGEVTSSDDDRLQQAVLRTGEALHAAGYSGPFGIDAFRHRVPGSRVEVLNPMSEINARFTMDWAMAMSSIPGDGAALAKLNSLTGR